MATRISAPQTKILNAHIEAQKNGTWDYAEKEHPRMTQSEFVAALNAGKTFEKMHSQIGITYCSITALLMGDLFMHKSKSYMSDIRRGYKEYLTNLGIV